MFLSIPFQASIENAHTIPEESMERKDAVLRQPFYCFSRFLVAYKGRRTVFRSDLLKFERLIYEPRKNERRQWETKEEKFNFV